MSYIIIVDLRESNGHDSGCLFDEDMPEYTLLVDLIKYWNMRRIKPRED